jgi:hypothetical protein
MSALERDYKAGSAAPAVCSILQRQGAAVSFSNLPAENESDSRAARLGREKRNEEIGGIRESRPFIKDLQLQMRRGAIPLNAHFAFGL